MPYLWSNPEDDKLNSANAPMPHISSGDIGSIVAAIMRSREQAAGRDRQDFNSMLSGIEKGVSGVAGAYGQEQQQGQSNDAANRAIYMSQNPGSMQQLGQMGADQFDQTYVPDYGGAPGYKAYQAVQDQESRDLKDALTKSRMAQIQQKLMGSGGSDGDGVGGMSPAEERRQAAESRRELNDQIQALKSQMSLSQLPKGATPHAMAPGEESKPGMYPFDVGGQTQYLPQTQVDSYNTARGQYEKLLQQRGLSQPYAGGPTVRNAGAPSVSQNDVNQVSQAKGDAGSLKQEAMDAIARGKDPAAVRARYKELTGQDL